MNLKATTSLLCAVLALGLGSFEADAKPKLTKGGSCIVPTECTNSIDATCAKLYCRALTKNCKGEYGSGDCKDIKDLHDAGMCSLAKTDCGRTLPKIFFLGNFQIEVIDGKSYVVIAPEIVNDGQSDQFRSTIVNAAEAIRSLESNDRENYGTESTK